MRVYLGQIVHVRNPTKDCVAAIINNINDDGTISITTFQHNGAHPEAARRVNGVDPFSTHPPETCAYDSNYLYLLGYPGKKEYTPIANDYGDDK